MGTFFDIFISLSAILFGLCLAWLRKKRPASKGGRIFLKCFMQLCVIAAAVGLYFWYPLTPEKSPHCLNNILLYLLSSFWSYVTLAIVGYAMVAPIQTGERLIRVACFDPEKLHHKLRTILWSALILSAMFFILVTILGYCIEKEIFMTTGVAFLLSLGAFILLSFSFSIIGWLTLKIIAGLKKYWQWLNE